jgi:hypothetical protein
VVLTAIILAQWASAQKKTGAEAEAPVQAASGREVP